MYPDESLLSDSKYILALLTAVSPNTTITNLFPFRAVNRYIFLTYFLHFHI